MHLANTINKNYLIVFIFLGVILHLISVYFTVGFYSDDEHFQILEITAYLLGLNEVAINDPTGFYWEWEENIRMRPWFQPVIYFNIISLLKSIFLDNPFVWAAFLRLISSCLGFLSILYLYFTFKDYFFKNNKIFNCFLFFSFWFYPFLHSRTSSENLSITLFVISFCGLFQILNSERKKFYFINFIFFSFLMGISMVVKFTTVFSAFPFFLWILFFKFNFLRIVVFGLTILIALALGLYIDFIHWGSFKNTYYQFYIHNLSSNEVGRMKYFGVDPWYYYFIEIIKQLAPFLSLFFLIGLFLFWFKKINHSLTWVTLITLLVFSSIGHKEIRYIFPIYIFAPLFIAYFIEHIKNINLKKFIQYIAIFSNIIFLFITLFFPPNTKVGVYEYLFYNLENKEKVFYTDENPYLVNNMEPFFYTKFIPEINHIKKNAAILKNIWIVTNNYDDLNYYLNKNCKVRYNTYPKAVTNLNENWKRLKLNWSILYCK
tara:strand:- start:531 stop:1994 length:1464 start_codon:yes stop_codon:yes gene_type:complete